MQGGSFSEDDKTQAILWLLARIAEDEERVQKQEARCRLGPQASPSQILSTLSEQDLRARVKELAPTQAAQIFASVDKEHQMRSLLGETAKPVNSNPRPKGSRLLNFLLQTKQDIDP